MPSAIIDAISQAGGTLWFAFILSGAAVIYFLRLTNKNSEEIKAIRKESIEGINGINERLNALFTGELMTVDGKVTSRINGTQDKQIQEIEKTSKEVIANILRHKSDIELLKIKQTQSEKELGALRKVIDDRFNLFTQAMNENQRANEIQFGNINAGLNLLTKMLKSIDVSPGVKTNGKNKKKNR